MSDCSSHPPFNHETHLSVLNSPFDLGIRSLHARMWVRDFNRFMLKRVVYYLAKCFYREWIAYGILFDLVSGVHNNGKCGGFERVRETAAVVFLFSRCFLFYLILFYIPENAFFLNPQTNHLYSILVRGTLWIITSGLRYTANASRRFIKHYDLHPNWNKISKRRKIIF